MPDSTGAAQRILLIEDDPLQSRFYERVLRGGNYDAAVFGDPLELLASIGDSAPPDLLLVDILLPRLDGLSLCARLAQNAEWCRVPTLLMTAAPHPDLLRAAQRLPVPPEAFLAKPLDARTILRAVRRVLAAEDPRIRLRRALRRRLSLAVQLQRHLLEVTRAGSGPAESEPVAMQNDEPETGLSALRSALEDADAEIDRIQALVLRADTGDSAAVALLPPEDGGSEPSNPAGFNPISGDSKSHRERE